MRRRSSATLALQGGPIDWIATHRAHHAHTDKEGDPHDIHRGLLWSHFEWLYKPNDAMLSPAEQLRLAPDLANDKFYRFLEKHVPVVDDRAGRRAARWSAAGRG